MSLTPIPESELAILRAAYPDIPPDYLSFLSTRGWGELASGVQLYSGPIAPEEIFGPRAGSVPDVLLIADDFSGTSFAFVPSQNWSIVAIDSLNMRAHPESASFTEFLSDYHDNSRNA
jgi:hypothetical protein